MEKIIEINIRKKQTNKQTNKQVVGGCMVILTAQQQRAIDGCAYGAQNGLEK